MPNAGRDYRANVGTGAIGDGVGARRFDSDGIDVAAIDCLAKRPRRGDGQNPCAGSDVENAPGPAAAGDSFERAETAERRAVMAGAEGERRFDLDADMVDRNLVAVVGAVHEKAPGAHGGEAGKSVLHPVLFGHP